MRTNSPCAANCALCIVNYALKKALKKAKQK